MYRGELILSGSSLADFTGIHNDDGSIIERPAPSPPPPSPPPSPPPYSPPPSPPPSSDDLNVPLIVGIAVAGALVVGLLSAGVYVVVRTSWQQQNTLLGSLARSNSGSPNAADSAGLEMSDSTLATK